MATKTFTQTTTSTATKTTTATSFEQKYEGLKRTWRDAMVASDDNQRMREDAQSSLEDKTQQYDVLKEEKTKLEREHRTLTMKIRDSDKKMKTTVSQIGILKTKQDTLENQIENMNDLILREKCDHEHMKNALADYETVKSTAVEEAKKNTTLSEAMEKMNITLEEKAEANGKLNKNNADLKTQVRENSIL